MNSKILMSLLMVGVASAGTGYGTYAFFSDTETSTGNIFQNGDLNLRLNGADGVTGTLTATNFAPGDSVSGSIALSNVGSILTGDARGHTVDLDLKAAVAVVDDLGGSDPDDGGDSSAAPLSQWLVITTMAYDGQNLLTTIGDIDLDGRANTLADLVARGVIADLADPGTAGKTLSMTVLFDTAAPNHLKRDSVDLSMTFFLAQAGEVDLV